MPYRPGHREHRRRFRSARRQPSSSSADALRNGDHSDRADVRFARPNIQIYDAHVVDLYQWVCARHFVGVKGAETKASAVKLGSRPNFRTDHVGFQNAQTQSGNQPSKNNDLPYISIGYGGESVSQPHLFCKQFYVLLDGSHGLDHVAPKQWVRIPIVVLPGSRISGMPLGESRAVAGAGSGRAGSGVRLGSIPGR